MQGDQFPEHTHPDKFRNVDNRRYNADASRTERLWRDSRRKSAERHFLEAPERHATKVAAKRNKQRVQAAEQYVREFMDSEYAELRASDPPPWGALPFGVRAIH